MPEEQEVKPDAVAQAIKDSEAQILRQARGAVKDSILDHLVPLLEGVVDDLELYANELAQRAVAAAMTQDDVSLESIKRQTVMLAEQHRIRAANAAWGTVQDVANIVLDTSFRALSATLLNIR